MTDVLAYGGGPATVLAAEPTSADVDDLRSGLVGLAGLVACTLGLEELLARVATFAVRAVPGADGAGVTLLRADHLDNRVEVMAASTPFVDRIDEIQYVEVEEGPCITAAWQRRTVRSGSLGGEKRWPRFGPRVGRLGVHSVLSLPLLLPDQVVGAIEVYAYGKDVFGDRAAELGERFAGPAAVAVRNAQALTHAMTLTTQLQTALSSRPVIDQAIGILLARTGGTTEQAFARLRTISQAEHIKLAEVAQHIVEEAARRARAQHIKL